MILETDSKSYDKIVRKARGLPYTRYINRPVAWFFSVRLLKYSPNQISIFAFILLLVGLIIGLYDFAGDYTGGLIWLVFAFNYVLDSSDGQVARIKSCGSALGEWVDHSLDAVRIVLINSYAIYVLTVPGIETFGFLLYLCLIGQVSLFSMGILRDKILVADVAKEFRDKKGFMRAVFSIATFFADHGIFILIFLVLSNLQVFGYLYLLYGFYFVFLAFATFLMIYKSSE